MSSIASGNTHSTQLFKHVAGGKSRAVYQGKVTVAKGADGSDSSQTAKALLLGEQAEADLKPELEIFADDVKCAHGAAVGDLDADSLFYLRARGIPEAEARGLLLHAFLEDAVAEIADDDLREHGARPDAGGAEGDRMNAPANITDASTPKRRARISKSCRAPSMASRWSIWTAAPAPRSRAWCWMPCAISRQANTPMSIAACITCRPPPPTAMKRRAAPCRNS